MSTTVFTYLQRVKLVDPALAAALEAMATKIDILDKSVSSVQNTLNQVPITGLPIANDVTVFFSTVNRTNVTLHWTQVDDIQFYEIRIGATWDTASRLLVTPSFSATFEPLIVGTTKYWIKGIDFDGNYSVNPKSVDVIIPDLGLVPITSQTFGSNVLLYWGEPTTTFNIDHYTIKKNGVLIGEFKGTFTNLLELSGGTFNYTINAIDIAGNISPDNTITVIVAAPQDFELQSVIDSSFTGTKTNCVKDGTTLVAPVNTAQTWAQHFSSHGWNTIQDQISAGYPIYSQPSPLTASYVETFDLGAVFNNTVISVGWASNLIAGTVIISASMEFSTDNVTWTAPIGSSITFIDTVRYVRLTINFNATNDLGLIVLSSLRLTVNVHREVDSGNDIAVSSDVSGTEILFNKAFKDVDSITLSTESLEPVTIIYEFTDIPDPTSFFVFAFDNAGKRITYPFSWKARGII